MSTNPTQTCRACGAPLLATARFCSRCGTAVRAAQEADEVMLPGSGRLRISADTLSLPELLNLVESGVAYWRRRLESAQGVAREQAAEAIRELSRILDSLAEQIAIGRETVRITGRLPAQRESIQACGVCGRGNRASAKYCIACGTALALGAGGATRPPPRLQLAVAARSDRGMTRAVNEDTCYSGEFSTADGTIGTLLLVADGMGGHAAGDTASQWAAETIKHELRIALERGVPASDDEWHTLLNHAVQQANQRVYAAAHKPGPQKGMGTTLTIALLTDRRAHLAHVGDSRAYLINPAGVSGDARTLMQLTHDHSIVARLVDIGQLTAAEARVHPQRNMIYRSLGADPLVEVDLRSQSLAAGDVVLLCSDGLTTHVEDEELANLVQSQADPGRLSEALIALANQRGGLDNISIAVARVAGRAAGAAEPQLR